MAFILLRCSQSERSFSLVCSRVNSYMDAMLRCLLFLYLSSVTNACSNFGQFESFAMHTDLSTCFSSISSRYFRKGWSTGILVTDTTTELSLKAEVGSDCDISAAVDVGTATVEFTLEDDGTRTVRVVVTAYNAYEMASSNVYVGNGRLPEHAGALTDNPSKYPSQLVNTDPATATHTFSPVYCDQVYVIIYAKLCDN